MTFTAKDQNSMIVRDRLEACPSSQGQSAEVERTYSIVELSSTWRTLCHVRNNDMYGLDMHGLYILVVVQDESSISRAPLCLAHQVSMNVERDVAVPYVLMLSFHSKLLGANVQHHILFSHGKGRSQYWPLT